MLRRSILNLSSRRSVGRIPRQIASQQIPPFTSFQRDFSTPSKKNASPRPGTSSNPPEYGGDSPNIFLRHPIVGAAAGVVIATALATYQFGFLDQYLHKENHIKLEPANLGVDHENAKEAQDLTEAVSLTGEDLNRISPETDHPELKVETHTDLPHHETDPQIKTDGDLPHPEASSERKGGESTHVQDKSDVKNGDRIVHDQDKEFPEHSHSNVVSNDQGVDSVPHGGNIDVESSESKTSLGSNEDVQVPSLHNGASAASETDEAKTMPPPQITAEDRQENALNESIEPPSSLLDAYRLREKADESTTISLNEQGTGEYKHLPQEGEAFVSATKDMNDGYISKDGKLVLDFLQAIHAAEERQAEMDARAFAEEKRALKEKYERELRDSRARELMRMEETALLEKELKREKMKAVAAIKSLQEKMEEQRKKELEQKESEAELKLKELQELAKAELAAAITSEKAAQIERMAEANLNINALCMAFYARSEEARQSHSVHKLALATLALDDALSKGLPIQREVNSLHTYLEGVDRDSILDLVLSSLPEEMQQCGTDTILQLNRKFNDLKGMLQHFSLIPPGGGGILAHSLAHIASWLKVREVDQSGDGIESVINRVESYLTEGKLAEAADALEEGVKGSQAEEIVGDWVRRVRNRAIAEQALTLLQSYATCISLT
ncbi:hypothetical protein HS088_TW13G00861 [Tripterygium wilfordii]|uniref:Formation of crista junctions protein 1 n=1 Tax=Tripterygium wilfordii TaxID=458696 RepID=A0A7J7CVE1_TRIWF|nr:MICOS complex subunit MIC60 [Tripterygium wilfordii]KAF5737968.1 hypothetical protein HS088_TW13G00861 [Tripterygium wilfordii]